MNTPISEPEQMKYDFRRLAKRAVKIAGNYKFHLDHAHEARQVLRKLEMRNVRLSPRVLNQVESYARDVFGNAVYAPWLRVYAAICGSFKEGWIPDNYYGAVVLPRTKGWYGKISTLRSASSLIFHDESFPDIGYAANGLFYTMQGEVISEANLKNWVFRNGNRAVFKLDASSRGGGVLVLDRDSFNIDCVRAAGNGVFQPFIRQHEIFDLFNRDCVATLRLTTAVDQAGRISLRACFLRLGRSGETHVQTSSEICIPVDPSTGDLNTLGYLADWTDVIAHPDSRMSFRGVQVPAFSRCVAKVLELHRKVPFICCIGWDIAVDNDGNVKVLEWNGEHNDIKFGEATQGPCFSDLGWERLATGQQ